MRVLRGLVTAVRTLTTVRIPGADAEHLGAALPWFPVAGAIVGGLVWAAGAVTLRVAPAHWTEAAALIMVVVYVLVTGGLHLDGLADCADALGARGNRERALLIMKDSHTGAFGVMALTLLLLGRWVAYVRLADTHALAWVLAASVVARAGQVHLMSHHPYARQDGTAAGFVRQATRGHACVAGAGAALLVVAVGGLTLRAGVALALTWALSWAWGMWCRGRFGGITGDTIGAGSEMAELAVLVTVAWMR
ncbi:MAG: adenosylcobinamide-GDP ribazoletransferase [Lentisphaerae bacterium]|nr:adenosylcobinamide-GDP ribazoletransferase [Lentisphaerota bacterium]